MHMTMKPFAVHIATAYAPGWGHIPEDSKTMWPMAEDVVRSPDVSAWKSDGLRSADGFHVLSVDGTMEIAMGVPRREGRL